jgi:DNA-binding IclR family transcriptional regulator
MPNEPARPSAPQSVTRVLQILDTLSTSQRPMGLAGLSRALNTPKSSLAALLRGLVEAGYVVATEGAYRLGASAFGLGSALVEARRQVQTSDIIRDGMRQLSDRCGESVLFAVANNDRTGTMTYVDIVESRNAIRFSVRIGDRRPLYCTAGGRALLSAVPEDHLKCYLKGAKLEKLTSNTETNRAKLTQAVREARKEGVARTYDEAADGVTGTASLIRDASGAVLGALVVAAPTGRAQDRGNTLATLVRMEAAAISRNLGYRLSV